MKLKILKDLDQRTQVHKLEIKEKMLKSLRLHGKIPAILKFYFIKKINYDGGIKHRIRIKNRCIFSGYSRSNYKILKVSRQFLRNLALKGFYPGIKKSVW
uniref:30S ribosomal protein S14 n=1 Tax=Cyanidium caldarium TaxID=2771 RepID=A0A7H0WBC8_CYACA|nr:30S ribosomal protein S14 [Cyanidium caldarium]QNR39857.1 30S ribosomal protein S14 [Cyanidium caldarium]